MVKKYSQEKHTLITGRIDVCVDFIINLANNIIEYYVDKDSISKDKTIKSHFDWCFDKTCDDFFMEGIFFYDNDELREYFYNYFYNQFYTVQDNVAYNIKLSTFEKFWRNVFNLEKQQTANSIKLIVQIYELFDKSINNKKKII
jgi:hypothetical protein